MTPYEFYEERALKYTEMDEWLVKAFVIAMEFAKDYGDKRELLVRQEFEK